MQEISDALIQLLQNPMDWPIYRPPKWESPIEESLWSSLRAIGVWVETQVPIGRFRVDMVVASRLTNARVIVECDGAQFHNDLVDDFRDDELIQTVGLPIAHIYGSEVVRSADECAAYIVERWFPKHMDTFGYTGAIEKLHETGIEHVISGCKGFFPVGRDRPNYYGGYVSSSDEKVRDLVRYITEDAGDFIDLSDEDEKFVSTVKQRLRQHDLIGRKLSPQLLARAYILICYEEPHRSIELAKFDEFINRLKNRNGLEDESPVS
jgi:very-short-patch-repair endonuclease